LRITWRTEVRTSEKSGLTGIGGARRDLASNSNKIIR